MPLVLGAGVLAVLVAVGVVLTESGQRQAGSNYVPELTQALTIKGAGEHCQVGQILPGDTAAVRLLVGTFDRPGPLLEVMVRADGKLLTSGRLAASPTPPTEHVVVPLRPVEQTTSNATVCVRVRAKGDRRTALFGTLGQVRLEWLRDGRESWAELLPTVLHRFALGKANPVGPWLLPVAALLLLLAIGAALRLAARELRV